MDIDTKIKKVLQAIVDGGFNENSTLSEISRRELQEILLMSEDEGFLSHRSSKQKLVQGFIGQGDDFILSPSAYVTRPGRQFLEDYDRTRIQSTQTINIESVSHSSIGNYNTVNNYSDTPIEDLNELVESLNNDDETKEQGRELIETLKNEEIKPGYLAKFEQLLQKHPKTVELISSFLTSVAVASIA